MGKKLAALQFPVELSVADLEPIRVEKAFLSLREESEGWAKTLFKVFEYSFYLLETIILKPYFLIFFPLFARTAAVILSLREKIKSNIENDSQLILEFFSSGFLILQAISVMSLIGLIIARLVGRVHLIEEALQLERFASVEDQTPSLQAHEESVSLLGWLVRELEYKIFSTVEARPVDHSLPVIERLSKDPSLRYEIQPQSEEELYFF